jgi:hypothetical protein
MLSMSELALLAIYARAFIREVATKLALEFIIAGLLACVNRDSL